MVETELPFQWDAGLIALSYILSVQASYSTVVILQLKISRWMTVLGAFCLSISGIWAMHFVGMAAFSIGTPISFNPWWTAGSAAFAFLFACFGLLVAGEKIEYREPDDISIASHIEAFLEAPHGWIFLSGVTIALGVCCMHYTGMQAMESAARARPEWGVIFASCGIAVAAATAALYLALVIPLTRRFALPTAIIMGVAVCGMHYTGMHGFSYWLDRAAHPVVDHSNNIRSAVIYIASASWAVSVFTLGLASYLHRSVMLEMTQRAILTMSGALVDDDEASNEWDPRMKQMNEAFYKMNMMMQSFMRYVPRDVVKELLETGDLCSAVMQPAHSVILFADIRGFTSLCERVSAEELASLVSSYFRTMSRTVMHHSGTVDKFIGDCIMAIWGCPLPIEFSELRATLCAASMAFEAFEGNLASLFESVGEALAIRIGVNSGFVLAGNMGSEERMSYTVIGDPVNYAARLEGLNKPFGTTVLVSDSIRARVSSLCVLRLLALAKVQGRDRPGRVYEFIGVHRHARMDVGDSCDGSTQIQPDEPALDARSAAFIKRHTLTKSTLTKSGEFAQRLTRRISSYNEDQQGSTPGPSGQASSRVRVRQGGYQINQLVARAIDRFAATPLMIKIADLLSRFVEEYLDGHFQQALDLLASLDERQSSQGGGNSLFGESTESASGESPADQCAMHSPQSSQEENGLLAMVGAFHDGAHQPAMSSLSYLAKYQTIAAVSPMEPVVNHHPSVTIIAELCRQALRTPPGSEFDGVYCASSK